MRIAIILPTYNEKKNIKKLIISLNQKLKKTKIVIIDDSKNTDIKREIQGFNNVSYFYRGKKLGRGSAVLKGLKFSFNKINADFFIEMDSDFSHNTNELKKNFNLFLKKKYDLLISSRYLDNSEIINWPLKRKILSYLSNKLAYILLRIPVSDYTNGFRIYSRKAVRHIIKNCGKIGDGFISLSEILVQLYFNNYRIGETSSVFINRIRGTSSVDAKEIIKSLYGLFKIFLLKQKLKKNFRNFK